jgi:CDP-diacylglycerol--glycerol-3-phosphate 3-phosphatidyltransferase
MARVAVIPVVMWLMAESDDLSVGLWQAHRAALAATLLFGLAGITDFLDGWLARRLDLQSAFGRFLDPLADKLLVMVCLIELVHLDRVPAWLVALLLSREVGITGLRAIAVEEGFELPSDRFGKWKTALQITGLVGLLLHFPVHTDFFFFAATISYHRVGLALLCLSMVFSLVSASSYLATFVRSAFGRSSARAPVQT